MKLKFDSPIEYLEDIGGARIYIKRDDLIPYFFGGNKVRIAHELIENALEKGFTHIITYGSEGSNMNRAVSLMAKAYGLNCTAIVKRLEKEADGEKNGQDCQEKLNDRLTAYSGARIVRCDKENVSLTVQETIESLKAKGEKPYYIYGNIYGTGNRTALMSAYFKEYGEISKWELENGINFKHIFLAAGTGYTIGGLAAGRMTKLILTGNREDAPLIHGISISRDAKAEEDVIIEALNGYNPYILDPDTKMFDISDVSLGDGYGKSTKEIDGIIRQMLFDYGIIMDRTYSAKAYYGMRREILEKGFSGNCLFIHTGGTPGFSDSAKEVFA